MDFKKTFKPSKGTVALFLILFLLFYFFILPFFSLCRAQGGTCRLDEPRDTCEQRGNELRRNCEIYINTMTILFLLPSYLISSVATNSLGGSKIGKFVSQYFWKILFIGIILTLISVIRSERESIPDLEQIMYGFPLPWLFHVLSGFEGRVDKWYVQWPILLMNFIFWYLISFLVLFVWNRYNTKSPHPKKEESF
jgi:hypothetical protein